ncbi:MAG: acyl carrier protein [Angelakisella sp.]
MIVDNKEIFARLNEVFRDVFDRADISVAASTVAADIKGWDSLQHITLMQAVEDEFDVKFSMREIVSLQNVGDIAAIIAKKN